MIFGSIAVPGWILALWYIGGDVYRLIAQDSHGGVNVLAHVAGGIAGYLYGFIFLRKARAAARTLQHALDPTAVKQGP